MQLETCDGGGDGPLGGEGARHLCRFNMDNTLVSDCLLVVPA